MIYSEKVPNAIKSLEAAKELAFSPPHPLPLTTGPPLPKTWCNEKQIDHLPHCTGTRQG